MTGIINTCKIVSNMKLKLNKCYGCLLLCLNAVMDKTNPGFLHRQKSCA